MQDTIVEAIHRRRIGYRVLRLLVCLMPTRGYGLIGFVVRGMDNEYMQEDLDSVVIPCKIALLGGSLKALIKGFFSIVLGSSHYDFCLCKPPPLSKQSAMHFTRAKIVIACE